ncbi:pyrroloquinoline quinone biosynthesis peptide chaperone PqqD [uncultured Thiothrix sp.]|jgi:pyrroloquinoline quinone biosynthesis protein D|uniref:pyrroloquinoline quinone biosynthesis peptide chaperone PqqD n=1 Tax=uncultured Thiothrix sp. TaxID=223185 RepID=UPI00262C7CA0|nr:pyrroloquinoline quinone biosynthesis peptide chaperone PqqD [uncultured Thiothrix sp.]HMT91538.1 pyrroloquinoline quinone biosynthesis peptide chaperone PqqD [Thiolinea sp.]
MSVDFKAVPRLATGYRFQWEEAQQNHVLLYPEGMVQLSDTAAAVLSLCDGKRTVEAIVAELEEDYETEGLDEDVTQFLTEAEAQGWVKYG